MPSEMTRRDALQRLLAAGAAIEFAGLPLPLLAQSEEVVPFAEGGESPAPAAASGPPRFDPRSLRSFTVSNEEFFTVQHYPVPSPVDPGAYKLRITGLVKHPVELSLAELKKRSRIEQTIGYECSGNNKARGNPLIGNATWTGAALAPLLKEVGLEPTAREIVFFSYDHGVEEIAHSSTPQKVEQHFARSLAVDEAIRPEVMLAWEMNGAPLPHGHGAPVRLVVPGWYGVANVKWLDHIHVQETRFAGRFMARDYVTFRSEKIGDETIWFETWVSRMRLKSAIARVTRTGRTFKATGFALTDGSPLKAVEVSVDRGPWRPATMWKENSVYSWKLFTFEWSGSEPGDHTIVSRAIGANGEIQPEEENATKATRWENNAQSVRTIRIS